MKRNTIFKTVIIAILVCLSVLFFASCHKHEYTEKIVKEATCGEAGEKLLTCSECEKEVTEEIPPTGKHSYDEIITKEATCVEAGEKKCKCTVCAAEETKEIPATGEHNYTESVTKEPTCEEDGEKAIKCTMCGNTKTESIAAIGHDWADATCTEPQTCTNCKQTQGEALGHKWSNATCEKPQTCSVCKETKGSAKGHSTRLGTCSVCGKKVNLLKKKTDAIIKSATNAANYENKSLSYCNQALKSTRFTGTSTAVADLALATGQYRAALDKCGSEPELADAKAKIKKIISILDGTFSGTVSVYGDTRDEKTIEKIVNSLKSILPYEKELATIMAKW